MKRLCGAILALAMVFSLGACAPAETTWQEQYDLGLRYLSEGNYEQAIIAFTAAIEIDPQNPKAHIGMGDTYAALAEQSDLATEKKEYLLSAKQWYEKAQEQGDEGVLEKVAIIQQELDRMDEQERDPGDADVPEVTEPLPTESDDPGEQTPAVDGESDSEQGEPSEEVPTEEVPTEEAPAETDEPEASVELPEPVRKVTALTQEHFDYAEEFRNGYAFAIQGLDCGYIDRNGNFTVYYQRADPVSNEDFGTSDYVLWQYLNSDHQQMWVSEEGLFPMYDRGTDLWGYGDIHTGEMVIQPAYDDACPFSEGRAITMAWSPDTGYEYAVINTAGHELFALGEMLILADGTAEEISYQDGRLWAWMPDADGISKVSLLDKDGKVLYRLRRADMGDGIVDNYGVHGGESSWDLEAKFYRGDPTYMYVQQPDGEAYYIDSTGKVTARLPQGASYGYAWIEGEKASFYNQDGLIGLFNAAGAITPPIYFAATWMNRGVSAVTENGAEWYLINDKGERLGSNVFEEAGKASEEGLIAVKQNGKWGYADLTGQIVIPCQFASARRFSEGIAFVRYSEGDQAWSIINTRGEDITGDIQATETSTNEEGFYLIEEEEGWRHIYCGS